ncbi:heterogeneous nuclear ribonucleoprotein U-like protein 2 [Phasianus colchicus]|uniref:heterogeneous nuclear ribonucleoprotein U-like protein 2 n=1 Tax=Phasianus colchicus TaxID=9054 RepID=UPI00129E8254|nr:heterogeneous nuclear ribonucleoprotein U-like protein 2 [Phasianus colchicus]
MTNRHFLGGRNIHLRSESERNASFVDGGTTKFEGGGLPHCAPLPIPKVLLMVGLPGSGKTQWAQKHSAENQEKRYNILGTELVLHQMRTRGPEVEELDAKSKDLLIQQAAQCLSKLVQIAPRAKRNFILDQCNVYNSGQRRKLLAFKGFCRKVVVVVPTEDDWKKRLELRKEAEGEDVPESVMLEMKGGLQEWCLETQK